MDETVKQATVYRSLRKFFIDNLYTDLGIEVSFDRNLSIPYMHNKDLTEWVSIQLDELYISQLTEQDLRIYCCTRQDPEGFNRVQLVDNVNSLLINDDGNKKIIHLYADDFTTVVGSLLPFNIRTPQQNIPLADETVFTLIRITLKWAAKV